MSEPTPQLDRTSTTSLDDRLKQAEIEKTTAETKKLLNEADAVKKSSRGAVFTDTVKIVGALILGAGGLIAGITQYQLQEFRAEIASQKLAAAEGDTKKEQSNLATAKLSETAAQRAQTDAENRRDKAKQETAEAQSSLEEVKVQLARLTSQVQLLQPNLVKARLVYIQFRGAVTRERINDLRLVLKQGGYNAPGAERIDANFGNIVKFFSAADRDQAQDLARKVEAYFSAKNCPISLDVQPSTPPSGQTPPLEVWISLSCK